MKPTKTFVIYKMHNSSVVINAYDNGDGVPFYVLETTVSSDSGSSSTTAVALDGGFDPSECGKNMISADLNNIN